MDDEGFYITLPCNASLAMYPDNQISSYRIHLSKALVLKGRWQVGLIEFQYPRTWETLNEADGVFFLNKEKKGVDIIGLTPGYYPDMQMLVDELTRLLTPHKIWFGYDIIRHKVHVDSEISGNLKFKPKLSRILGLPVASDTQMGVINLQSSRVYAPHPADISCGFYTLYVYTDVIQHQVVGDHFVPLLKCVDITGSTQEAVTVTYEKPHYVTVSKDHITDIAIEVKTDQDIRVPFKYGKVIAKLHFRPVRHRV